MSELLTASAVARLAPRSAAQVVASVLAPEAARCEISTPLRLAHWMAQMSIECEGFTRFAEDLDYTVGDLRRVWPGRFPTIASAQPYAHKPAALANLVYGSREGNGPTESGDGWRFRGRGFLMRTFRKGYAQAAADTGLDLLENPDQLASVMGAAAKDSADYWRSKHINQHADADDLEAVTRAINGGLTNLQARKDALTRAKAIWA